MKLFVFTSFLVVLVVCSTDAKIYERCEFAKYLLSHGFNKNSIGTWSCIAYHESRYDTKAINKNTWDYGILQISSKYWCNQGSRGCGITCNSLLTDDIAVDLKCARKVFDETKRLKGNGFEAWTTYKNCRGDTSKYVKGCF
ncbi:lysozyme C [Aethina tumida]|uniref:lysozyme C n=1 Tax=Aethina tumida TaxID=116153 RepID=UPI00096B0CBC|nr:lysozyme C [Aethina tumida]